MTKTQYYAGGAVIFLAIVAALSWVYNGARNGAIDASKAEVAAAVRPLVDDQVKNGARVSVLEGDVGGLKEQVKDLDKKFDTKTASLETLVRDTEKSVKAEIGLARSDISAVSQNVQQILQQTAKPR